MTLAHQACCEHWAQGPSSLQCVKPKLAAVREARACEGPRLVGSSRRSRKCLACYAAAMQVYAETSAKNAKFKKVYDHYTAFQKEQILWFRVTENTYDNYMATAGQAAAAKGQAAPAKK